VFKDVAYYIMAGERYKFDFHFDSKGGDLIKTECDNLLTLLMERRKGEDLH
jgi:hypothetical protein